MTPEKVIEAIMKQIDAASPILQRLTYTKALPGGIKAGGAQALRIPVNSSRFNYVNYIE